MSKVLNFTPQPLHIFAAADVSYDAAIGKNVARDGAAPVITIPSSGILSARIVTSPLKDIDNVPVFVKKVAGCDSLPDGTGPVVVSALFVKAARSMAWGVNDEAKKMRSVFSRLHTVADPVYSADGRTILGCLGICPAL